MGHPIPAGHHAITPHLVIKGASEAIEFYKRAFGAEELCRMPFPGPDATTRLGHAELQIGDSRLFLADEFPEYGSVGPTGSSPVTIHLYVTDADATFARAVAAGATVAMPLQDMFWGDRYGQLRDSFGVTWALGGRPDARGRA
jgi:PhnB protein